MKILAIETSCDETGAAVVEKNGESVTILSNVVATSMQLHALTGGIIPEVAARNQITYIIPVIADALEKAGLSFDKNHAPLIDALAVTYGPGLIGSLLVGVETAKTVSYLWDKPLIPVNHLFGHIYANWIIQNAAEQENHQKNDKDFGNGERGQTSIPQFPLIALIVSGGHTDLLLMKNHTDITWLGGTRDDAAGEAFDKIGRLLSLPYPAGPKIEQLAKGGNPYAFHFPRPLLHESGYDFSFSGLKTAVLREVQKITTQTNQNEHSEGFLSQQTTNDICRGVQDAITEVLVTKTQKAAEQFHASSIILSGGVAANETLRTAFQAMLHRKYNNHHTTFYAPPKNLCTDNAAMIGAAACFRNHPLDWNKVMADPELYFA